MYLGINTGAGGCAPVLTTTTPPPQPAQLSRARAKQREGRGQHRGGGATAEGGGARAPPGGGALGGLRERGAAPPSACPRGPLPGTMSATEHGGAFRCLLSPRARCLWAQRVVGGTGIAGGCCCPKAASWLVTRLTPNAGVRMGTQWFDFQLFLDTTKKV